jgi:two-component sensor histidine kinase
MTEIGASLRDFIAEEDASLLARNDSVAGLRAWLSLAILAALAGAVVLTYALFTRTQRTVGSLYRSASELREQAAELERAVRDRTTELEQARSHAERELERVESLLQETNHRIGNSLATVSSLLGLQMSRTRSDEVRAALEAAQNRVQSIASGHRRLRLGADLETTQLDDFLHAAAEDMQNTFLDGRQVELVASVAPLIVQARDATTIGIIVGELVMNAAKHAFPGERSGRIELSLERGADDVVTLIVADDGEGYSTDGEERGLGTMIVRQLVAQFGGEARHESNTPAGTRVVITLPGLASKVPPVAAT